jgi:uncharacterized protein YecA (UPF0149 family)
MPPERNRVLAGERISRARVAAAGTPEITAIEAALAAWDHEEAALLSFARARTAEVPAALVARILPGIEFAQTVTGLIAIASGDKAALLELVERRTFPQTKETAELEGIVLYAAWKAGAPRERVLPELRRISVRSMTAEGYALIAAMARALDDANASAVVKDIDHFADEYAKSVASDERAMTASPDAVIAALPADVEVSRGGFTVRAAAKQVGRNDPCPCGSGLKYKKCCADKPVASPSPIPGVAWEDFLGKAADQITDEHVAELAIRDLVQIDLSRMQVAPLIRLGERFAGARAWQHAERVIDELARRGGDQTDDLRDYLIHQALDCGDMALVRAHVAKLPRELAELYDLDMAAADARWDTLVRVARAAVASADKVPDIDLAYSLLRLEPALGIVAARACIGTLHVDDPDLLLDAVEEARDKLGLPPSDPAWGVLDALTVDSKTRKRGKGAPPKPAAHDGDRAQLHARIDELERTLSRVRGELDAARTRPAAELVRARVDEPEGRIEELEQIIREGNAERAALRRELAAAQAAPKAETRRPIAPVEEPDDDVDDLPPGTRGITLPRFDRKFADAAADVPQPVAAEALRTIGLLASGDGFSWKNVKQAKDMVRPLLMARVGIHHRLLFRVDDGVLDVLDLITRETLMTTLKRIRGAR